MTLDSYPDTGGLPLAPAAPGLWTNLKVMSRVIYALVLRESRTRYGRSDLGYFWGLFDPMMQLIVMGIIFSALNRKVPFNASMPVFLVTGILPYYFWRGCVSRGASAAASNIPLLTYPQVKVMDVIIARVLLDAATNVVIALIFVVGIHYVTSEPFSSWVHDPLQMILSYVTLFYFALCSAVFSANFARVFPIWPQIFNYLSRPLWFASGIFFTLRELPKTFAKYAIFNPIAHMLEWIRAATIPGFSSDLYNPWFILTFSTIALLIGMTIDAYLRMVGHSDESY
jgi:capsular polysaccharide transport system permease protein